MIICVLIVKQVIFKMWICENCEKHNQNKSDKCRRAFCNGVKSAELIKQEQIEKAKITIRDYCPKCMSHQDFTKIGKQKKFKCGKCRRLFKFHGKPVPEIQKDMIIT